MAYFRWQDHPPVEFDQDDTSTFNLDSTDYVELAPKVVVRFVAPTSGRVLVTVGGGARDSGGSNLVFIAAHVYAAFEEQSTVLAPASSSCGFCAGPESVAMFFGSRTVMVEGLVPGRRYVARPEVAVDGGSSADVSTRDILVEPVP